MPSPLPSLAINLDSHFLEAALPLLSAGEVFAAEWSFDSLHSHQSVPDWFYALLNEFGQAESLLGHGIYYSLFRAKWSKDQENWLQTLANLSQKFKFQHISEHFGFLTGENFHVGAPLAVPFNDEFLAIGIDRMKRLSIASKCPVGLENLAFAYSIEAAIEHGRFLESLLRPVNGFLVLDLHNLYCHLHNFDLSFEELLLNYPLHRVREIHISGGSFSKTAHNKANHVRRDTHDEAVPNKVFDMLEYCLSKCPNLKFVVLEQMGSSLLAKESKDRFREDFRTMAQILQHNQVPISTIQNEFQPPQFDLAKTPIESPIAFAQQIQLSEILENANDVASARQSISHSNLLNTDWKPEIWPDYMLETAIDIAQKWKNGFGRPNTIKSR